MPSVLDAEVVTRRTMTFHENPGTQVGRFAPDLWRVYAEKLPVSSEIRFNYIVVSASDDEHPMATQHSGNALINTVFSKWTPQARIFGVDEERTEFANVIRLFRDFLQRGSENVFLAIATRATNETSTPVSFLRVAHHGMQQRLGQELATDDTAWTKEKNRRRCELVDKEIAGHVSPAEQAQLKQLQAEMLAYRRKVAPLPLQDLRALHQQLLHEADDETE